MVQLNRNNCLSSRGSPSSCAYISLSVMYLGLGNMGIRNCLGISKRSIVRLSMMKNLLSPVAIPRLMQKKSPSVALPSVLRFCLLNSGVHFSEALISLVRMSITDSGALTLRPIESLTVAFPAGRLFLKTTRHELTSASENNEASGLKRCIISSSTSVSRYFFI